MLNRVYIHTILIVGIFTVTIPTSVVYATTVSEATIRKFAEMETHHALPRGILAKIAKIESDCDAKVIPKAGSKNTPHGLFQWINSSWDDVTKGLYGKYKNPGLRLDPIVATEVTAYSLAKGRSENQNLLQKSMIEKNTGLYLWHFLGSQGSQVFLARLIGQPDSSAAGVMRTEAKNNRCRFYDTDSKGRACKVTAGCTDACSFKQVADKIAKELQQSCDSIAGGDKEFAGTLNGTRIISTDGENLLGQEYKPDPRTYSDEDHTFKETENAYRSILNESLRNTEQQQRDLVAKENVLEAKINDAENARHRQEIQTELNDIRKQQQAVEQQEQQYELQRQRQAQKEERGLDQLDQQRRSDAEQQRTQQEQQQTEDDRRRKQQEQLAQLERDRPQPQQESHPPFQQTPQLQQSSQLQPQQQPGQGQQSQSPQNQQQPGTGQGTGQPFAGNSASGLTGSTIGTASTLTGDKSVSAIAAQPTPSTQNTPLSPQGQIEQAFNTSGTRVPPENFFKQNDLIDTPPINAGNNIIRSVIDGISGTGATSITTGVVANTNGNDSVVLVAVQRAFDTLRQLLTSMRGLF